MGRQIAVAASAIDEVTLLAFLRETAEVRIFRPCAPSIEQLWVEEFAPFRHDDPQYFIWHSAYAWKPKYERNTLGDYYIENRWQGPVIEFTRTDIKDLLAKDLAVGAFGRIYWYGSNRQTGFVRWYEQIIRWVRRVGHNISPVRSWGVWFLPDALRLWRQREQAG